MIVCSCNVFSENEVRRALASAVRRPRISQVYACLGYARQCGRCARTITKIMDEASVGNPWRHATRAVTAGGAGTGGTAGRGKPTHREVLIEPVEPGPADFDPQQHACGGTNDRLGSS
jgi:bacterioferritin-associated ferredoxin